jgi:formyltetrahydrofolate deformylase
MTTSAVLLLACPDRPGIVSRVSAHIAEQGGNILRAEQSESVADSHFYQRIHFDFPDAALDLDVFRTGFAPVAEELRAEWSLHAMDVLQKTAILVSRQPHCLLDLLGRWRVGDIPADIVAVISNHEEARDIAEGFRILFHHLPVTPETRVDQEDALDRLLRGLGVDLVVLARYMQILSDGFIERWAGRVINIHHSFLPAFPGAKPYHQAIERGVKLIGATAHYATVDLDEGPIIEQGVTATSHRDSVADFVRRGREVEARVLASAVRAHLEHRVIVAGRRTIVFE